MAGRLFDIAPRTRDTAFGFVFEGTLVVPKDGTYTFYLDSDDGSRLFVAGQTIVDYDGIHGLGNERNGNAVLSAGRVPIRLEYFQRRNGFGLSVDWSGPGVERRSLSAAATPAEPKVGELSQRDLVGLIRNEGERLLGAERVRSYEDLRRTLRELAKKNVPGETALCVTEAGSTAPETFVLLRGNAHVTGDKVEPAFLSVLGPAGPGAPDATARRADVRPPPGPGRLDRLAGQPADSRGSLPTGSGSITSAAGSSARRTTSASRATGRRIPSCSTGSPPSSLGQGWRLKPLHRLIMTSNAYRMSSCSNPEALAKDPVNDALLAVRHAPAHRRGDPRLDPGHRPAPST